MSFGQQFLDQVDASAQDFTFPFLDHGFYYAVDVRLHVYRDEKHWAVVFETVGFNPKARSVTDALTGYGVRGGSQLNRVENIADLIDDDENYIGGVPIRVRGRDLPVQASPGEYFAEVVRELVPEHRDLLLADESELRALIPPDLPEILRLEAWHHPDVLVERPSREETFQLIAKVLDSGNAHDYRPSQAPNTHWSNWPESGNA
ncbi:DUF7003 family protein [Catenulispora pinisilvae]|uniref:DUF7003 family protein n=1 Tax=Catenulispora pinisilvae TaxID=2705253 RepID=UPI001890E9B0|nr:hypothetical protein [Catenulispora pinisilvae]